MPYNRRVAFSTLEKNILKAKGLSDDGVERLIAAGVEARSDFRTVGDAATLAALLPGTSADVAAAVMAWALAGEPKAGGGGAPTTVTVESADIIYCVHCSAKQPKDYKSGDLCTSCGKQAEPIYACYWCSSSGPGKFCRQCGSEFLPTADLDLGLLLKHEGVAKEEVPRRLAAMSQAEKDVLWGRVRKLRG
jgi:hypothetical protein